MITLENLDPNSPFFAQIQDQGTDPVTIINTFLAPCGQADKVMEIWRHDAELMMSKGCISAQLHRGTAPGSRVMTNVAVWESTAALRDAVLSPEFQRQLLTYPDGTVAYPHLVRPIAVRGICIGNRWNSTHPQSAPSRAPNPQLNFRYLDPDLQLAEQLAQTEGPFTLLDMLIAPNGEADEAIVGWRQHALYMKARRGFISGQLYRGIGSSNVLINLAVWESAQALHEAVTAPEFAALSANYPVDSVCMREAMRRTAIPGICVA
ncbi:antibiotic biosynthesis monooxygenase [Mycolicibacterium sp. lyk4-40-TYG-92]|uniref:antibiotic biosynthesis monooxygenase family protein n=1 Tax=Mycolicibacterium sp. lyk4-40-TYG-92 TaxID=3040295 RepID=UPI00254A5A80|nr:antibiotic biosynthesis monooxygenase [Mycolicibacterium sp. lyk4-40-TYG-92]